MYVKWLINRNRYNQVLRRNYNYKGTKFEEKKKQFNINNDKMTREIVAEINKLND